MIADLVAALATCLHEASTAASVADAVEETLRRRIGLSVGARGVQVMLGDAKQRKDLDALARSLTALLERTSRAAADRGRLLLVTLDEVQNAGATALQSLCQLDLLRAGADVRLRPAARPDVAAAVRGMLNAVDVGIDPDALDRLVELIGGYPYFLHLYGKHAWMAGDGDVVTIEDLEVAAERAARDLDRYLAGR